MQLDKDSGNNEKSKVQTMAKRIIRIGAIRQGDRCNHRRQGQHWKELDNKISCAEKQGDKCTVWIGIKRYNAYVLKEGNDWMVYFRHAESVREADERYMERYRKHKKRVPMGRSVHVGRKVD